MKRATILFKLSGSALIVVLAILFNSCKKESFTFGVTKEFTLRSTSNNAFYEIKIGLPDKYNPAEKYATIYVLDGKDIYGFVANRCKEITDQLGTKNVLVVSIGYGRDRSIDYTPTKVSSVTGGAPDFLHFIETQLIPKMEQDYHADTSRESRVILGHSYGGLFGAYAFCVNNTVFGNYLLLSPSFWFDKYITLQMERDNRIKNMIRRQLVFMGIGANEEKERMISPFETFHQLLLDNYSDTRLAKNIEKNTSHMDSRNPNIIKGLIFYFQNR